MGLYQDIKRKSGWSNIQIWVEEPVHRAVKMKLAEKRLTMKDLITRFLISWSGYKPEK